MRTKNVRRPSFRAHGSSIFSGRPTARNLARYGTQTSDTFGYNTRSESPRRLGGGLDNARSGIAPKGRKHPTAVRVIRQCRRHCPRQGASCREAAASQRRNGVSASQPTQPTATRPLAIQKNGTWYSAPTRLASQGPRSQVCSRLGVWLLKPHPAYGWDLTKNICETYRTDGRIDLAYTYTPYDLAPAIPHEHYWGNREQVDGRDEGFSCESANE